MSALKHSQLSFVLANNKEPTPDIDEHLKQWGDLGWSLQHFSSSATTLITGTGRLGGMTLYYDFIWTQ